MKFFNNGDTPWEHYQKEESVLEEKARGASAIKPNSKTSLFAKNAAKTAYHIKLAPAAASTKPYEEIPRPQAPKKTRPCQETFRLQFSTSRANRLRDR